jgi:malonyl-CoA O-methyltransferase
VTPWTKLKRKASRASLRIRVRNKSPLDKAIAWVKSHRVRGSGIVTHHRADYVTQEVTGYLIPTLYRAGERRLACDLARWEASVQRADGSFVCPTADVAYTFDTAQVVRGFLAVLDDLPELESNVRRACNYVETHIAADGEVLHDSYETWRVADGSSFSPYCNLYVLPPLAEAGRRLDQPRYVEAAHRSLRYFKRRPDVVTFKSELGSLSHIFGYILEALVEMGETDLARKGLAQAVALQTPEGAIPAYPGVPWVCSTGVAQVALAWWKIGEKEPARKALRYLETIQNPSGGFYGSYGPGAQYLPNEEISWAAKYFIDLSLLIGEKHA